MKIPSRSHGLLGPEERSLVRSLIGQDVFLIYSPWIDATFDHFDCGPLSIALRNAKGFVVLDTEWEEDENLIDFGWMTVATVDRAKEIKYSAEGHPFCPSMVSLTPSSPIAKIVLYTRELAPGWAFNDALLVEHEERFRYVISYAPSAYQRLVVSFSEAEVRKVLGIRDGEVV